MPVARPRTPPPMCRSTPETGSPASSRWRRPDLDVPFAMSKSAHGVKQGNAVAHLRIRNPSGISSRRRNPMSRAPTHRAGSHPNERRSTHAPPNRTERTQPKRPPGKPVQSPHFNRYPLAGGSRASPPTRIVPPGAMVYGRDAGIEAAQKSGPRTPSHAGRPDRSSTPRRSRAVPAARDPSSTPIPGPPNKRVESQMACVPSCLVRERPFDPPPGRATCDGSQHTNLSSPRFRQRSS